jgi:hypothetical protein
MPQFYAEVMAFKTPADYRRAEAELDEFGD